MTAAHVLFSLYGYPKTISGYIAGFCGLFAPVKETTLVFLFTPSYLASVIVFIVSMILADNELYRMNLGLWTRILANLLILLILTIVVDWIHGTSFGSWLFFFGA